MSFAAPGILWALTLLAIPVIIHLFSFRRYRTVWFPDTRFLQQIEEETASKRNLKHLLVLLARLLALAFLIIAFAQPVAGDKEAVTSTTSRMVSIYIDNSYSMQADNDGRRRLDLAIERAGEIVNGYGPDDRFLLLTNNGSKEHTGWLSSEEVLTRLDEIALTPTVLNTNEAYQIQKDLLEKKGGDERIIYQISDFQKSSTGYEADTAYPVRLISVAGKKVSNLAIDSAWIDDPVQIAGEDTRVDFSISNYGEEDLRGVTVQLDVNGRTKGLSTIDIEAGTSTTDSITFKVDEGAQQRLTLSIQDYPVLFDDQLFMVVRPASDIRVACVSFAPGNRTVFDDLYRSDVFSYYLYDPQAIDYNALQQADFIILDQIEQLPSGLGVTLQKALEAGASVLVVPGPDVVADNLNGFLLDAAKVYYGEEQSGLRTADISLDHPLFYGVFDKVPRNLQLPSFSKARGIGFSLGSSATPVMGAVNGTTLMASARVQNGRLYLLASPFEDAYTDLHRQAALFVPMLFRMAVSSHSAGTLYSLPEQDQWVPIKQTDDARQEAVGIRVQFGDSEFIPSIRQTSRGTEASIFPYAEEAGFYTILSDRDTLETALNHSRAESDLASYSGKELEDLLPEGSTVWDGTSDSAAALIEKEARGRPLWKICIIFTLVFLAAEIALIRLWP